MRSLVSGLIFAALSISAQQLPKPVSEGAATIARIPEAVSDRLRFVAPLGDFDVSAIDGRHWRLADLKGRVTVISIWATTCGPCLREHPEIQRSYEKWRGSDRIQVLTFSVDSAPGAVRAYMLQKKYTFPVIVNEALSERLFSNIGIPQTWVVDRQGFRSEPFTTWSLGRIFMEAERLAFSKPN